MLDAFEQKKISILKEIEGTNEDNKDLSPKGTIDEQCLDIIKLINSHKDMVTTSSCSGRVSVFIEGKKHRDSQIGSKGNEGHWMFVTHDPNQLKDWHKSLEYDTDENRIETGDTVRYILYKFEPLILHIKCRNSEIAGELFKIGMSSGFRESGIGINNVVAIRISIKLDIPIGFFDEINQRPIFNINEAYIKFITTLSFDRFQENFNKLDHLYNRIEQFFQQEQIPKEIKETKEQRRERKIREGMAKRESVRTLKREKAQKLTENAQSKDSH